MLLHDQRDPLLLMSAAGGGGGGGGGASDRLDKLLLAAAAEDYSPPSALYRPSAGGASGRYYGSLNRDSDARCESCHLSDTVNGKCGIPNLCGLIHFVSFPMLT